MSKKKNKKRTVVVLAVVVIAGFVAYLGAARVFSIDYDSEIGIADVSESGDSAKPKPPRITHLPTPEPFKAIYMTQCVVGTPSFRDQLVSLVEETELNAIIIDVKDFSGTIGFNAESPLFDETELISCGARDMKAFLELLHDKGIYTVARITVFQDPLYARLHPELAVARASDGEVWKDHKGLSFIDVGAKPYWDYIVTLSKEAYDLGFDELNFDYIRYPSDGNLKDIAFPHSGDRRKQDALEDFFSYLYKELSDEGAFESGGTPKLSADLFGYTTTNTDDLGIGQVIERALPYFHYVMPMVYPSHYNRGFIGLDKPAQYPYEVVKYSMDSAVTRARAMVNAAGSTSTTTEATRLRILASRGHGEVSPNQLRPWLQDFDLGADYTPDRVRAQMQATYDARLTSWALWDAGNTYTRAALLDEQGIE